MSPIRDGAWYLVARCIFCGEAIPYMEVTEDLSVGGDGSAGAKMPCLSCKATATYRVADMVKVQAKSEAPPDVSRH